MKKYTIIFSILHLTVSYAVDSLAFDLRPETVMFEKVTHHLKEGQSPAIVEKTIVGHFYQNQYPLIKAGSQKGGIHLTPFGVLSEMLTLVQRKQYDDLPSLYSTETRDEVSSGLKDPDSGPQIKEWLDTLKTLSILGVWLESPNRLIAYVQLNGSEGMVRPYVFEFLKGWYLRAGHFESAFSNQLDAFYTKHRNDKMTILSPPSSKGMKDLLSDAGLVSFLKDLGLDIL